MLTQMFLNQRLVVQEDLKVNNSPLKMKIAFLNKEISFDSKSTAYQLLFWFVGKDKVKDFDFNLFLNFNNTQVQIPIDNLNQNFEINNENYLIAKIPSKNFDLSFNELNYSFSHDQLFKGSGKIYLNLENSSDMQIDNELIFYENQKSTNLIVRYLDWDLPEFYFNKHYQKLCRFNIKTIDYSYEVDLLPIKKMAALVKNDTLFPSLLIKTLQVPNQKYNFEPQWQITHNNDFLELNLLNFLDLNSENQVIETGLKPGIFFNPFVEENQEFKIKIQLFNLEKTISFAVRIPKLDLKSQFTGAWIEI